MSITLRSFKRKSFDFIIFCLGFMIEIVRALARYLKVSLLYQRNNVIKALNECENFHRLSPKVIAVIPHITSVEEAKDQEKAFVKVERLKFTIDGLLASFAHCDLNIIIKTVADRHITSYLPEYQIKCIQVQEESNCDPMFIGFRCQDELVNKFDDFDWFLFLEDDIVIHDSYFLEKLEKFNTNCGCENAVILPNRYELWEGKKRYVDLTILQDPAWNRLSIVEIEGVKFAESNNPHAGMYCLSKLQMKRWIQSGREWKNKNFGFGGPRECAATVCLLECFSLYKPHLSNLHFLEVRHYDTKYSQLYPDCSPSYIFSPIKEFSNLN